jgi:hypothetical protein
MASPEDYARWITANQDKIGTPEFSTVAKAYQQAKMGFSVPERRPEIIDPSANANPTDGMSGTQKFLAGVGKGMTDVARGVGQLVGLTDRDAVDETKRRDAPLMATGAGLAGNVAGTVAAYAPLAFIPGANSYAGATAIGAATGLMQPVGADDSRLTNTAVGGVSGFAGQALANGLSRVLNPQTSKAVTDLMDEGITPTPGQILGGIPQKVESALESVPFAGQAITGAKGAVVEEFNEAAINRALGPINKTVSAIGHEGMRQAREAVENSYDDALALLPQVQIDPQFDTAVQQIRSVGQSLIPDRARQFDKIIDDEIIGRIGGQQIIDGDLLHTIESQVKSKARQLLGTQGYDEQQMGAALSDIVGEIRGLAARNSPEAAEALKKADAAYAMLLRLERAAGSQGAPQGIFTPTQLGSAVRGMDRSLRKVDIAQGEGLMQDLATNGRQVLGGNLPNSGTADRAMMAAVLSGRGSAKDLVGMAVTGGMYTDVGRKALAAALTKRPEVSRTAGQYARRLAPAAAVGSAELVQALRNQ